MTLQSYTLAFDRTGQAASNLILDEKHTILAGQVRIVFPKYCAFFKSSISIRVKNPSGEFAELTDEQYQCVELLAKATMLTNREIYGAILIRDETIKGEVVISYQALGGDEVVNPNELDAQVKAALSSISTDWNKLNKPKTFNPKQHHPHRSHDYYGLSPVVQAISRITSITGIRDDAFEQSLLGIYFNEKVPSLFQKLDDDIVEKYSQVLEGLDTVHQDLILCNKIYLENEHDKKFLITEKNNIVEKAKKFQKERLNGLYAYAVDQLRIRQLAENGKLVDVPKLLFGLNSWLDFTDTNSTKFDQGVLSIADKAKPRFFIGANNSLVSNTVYSKQALRLQFDSSVAMTQGDDITIGFNSTVIVISARMETGTKEKGIVFSSKEASLSIDFNKTALMLQDSFGKLFEVPCSPSDSNNSHVTVSVCSADIGYSYSETSIPASNYGGDSGFKVPPKLRKCYFRTLGQSDISNRMDLLEILVYDRPLSEYELDAINEWVAIKYNNTRTQLLANPYFNEGLSDMESDYKVSKLASVEGSIDFVKRISNSITTLSAYDTVNFKTAIENQKASGGVLGVCVSIDTTSSFYRKKITLTAFKHYRFTMTVYCEGVAPMIGFYLNGTPVQGFQTTAAGVKKTKDFSFTFLTTTDECVLEMKAVRPSGSPPLVWFAVDDFQLIRNMMSVS